MNKNTKKRLTELESQKVIESQSLFLIMDFGGKDEDAKVNVYSRHSMGNDSPKVRQQPDEDADKFFERAKKELYGEDAEKPGVKLMIGWCE